jgi:hypothetical protein
VSYTIYRFDLRDLERGHFTALRLAQLGTRPPHTWVCLARDDEHALTLAKHAALVEWPQPTTRLPEEFSVDFVDGPQNEPTGRRSI